MTSDCLLSIHRVFLLLLKYEVNNLLFQNSKVEAENNVENSNMSAGNQVKRFSKVQQNKQHEHIVIRIVIISSVILQLTPPQNLD